jgi:polysaccharide export outer membrane protein
MRNRILISKWLRLVVLVAMCLSASACSLTKHQQMPFAAPPLGSVPRELVPVTLPPYVINSPDVLVIDAFLPNPKAGGDPIPLPKQPITGQFFVRPDGTVGLGVYGSVQVAGLTIDQAREAVRQHLLRQLELVDENDLLITVDVVGYNSAVYYVIIDGAGFGEQTFRFPVTGREFVLDALSQQPINGIPPVGSKRHIWVARRHPGTATGSQILPVDWEAITQCGDGRTNYQILPGDRIYVKAQHIIATDNAIAKILAPVERIFGITLLGASTVNVIGNRNFQNQNFR